MTNLEQDMKVMTARSLLRRLKRLYLIIENKQLLKEQWEGRANIITSGGQSVLIENKKGEGVLHNMEKVQTSSGGQQMVAAVAQIVDLEREIAALKNERKHLESILELLPVSEYDLLYKFHILEIPLKIIAGKYDKSYSWASMLHVKAIKNLQSIIDKEKDRLYSPSV